MRTKGTKAQGYEWMVAYTPQEVWIETRGLLLYLAFFFTEIFAGAYFISILLKFKTGMIVGWVGALALGGFFHLLYLGRPTRGWRILANVSTSELSRGLWLIVLYGAIGFLHILPMVFSGLPWSWEGALLNILMGIICVFVIAHGFMTMNVVKALPMWNSSMMLPLSLSSGIWVGAQIVVLTMQILKLDMALAELWVRWSLLAYIGALIVYLWGNMNAAQTAKISIKRILAGDCSATFYMGTVGIGIVIPLIMTLSAWRTDPSTISGSYFFIRFFFVMIGDASMRYCIMKAPLYKPLI